MQNIKRYNAYVCCIVLLVSWAITSNALDDDMVHISKGHYTPLFKNNDGPTTVTVEAFYIDRYPVTNLQFSQFTEQHPKWDKEKIKPVFSDSNYLKHFSPAVMHEIAAQPVTNISWFAARAYCRSMDKRLPTTDEWEYIAKASNKQADGSKEPEYRQKILDWYAKPATEKLPDVVDTQPNYWKVHGLHGVVWELVNDFNTSLVTGESRGDTQLDKQLFCGAGAASSMDPGDYAAFMRYAMRSSYSAHYTIESLGFRCAKDEQEDR